MEHYNSSKYDFECLCLTLIMENVIEESNLTISPDGLNSLDIKKIE